MQQQVCQKHEIPMTFSLPDDTNNFLAGHVALMANSFEQLFGRTIADVTGNESMVKKFYHAPHCCLITLKQSRYSIMQMLRHLSYLS